MPWRNVASKPAGHGLPNHLDLAGNGRLILASFRKRARFNLTGMVISAEFADGNLPGCSAWTQLLPVTWTSAIVC
jgi:hypothetical protein